MAEEIILQRCIVCGWTGCDIDHNKDRKTMDFIEACRKVHGYRFGYENTVYVRSRNKVIITCVYHGNFEQNANNHKLGQSCKKCPSITSKLAQNTFNKSILELGGRVIGEYINANTPVRCICPNGHECLTRPCNIQQNGSMCIICSGRDSKTAEQNFRNRIRELGGQVVGEYKGNKKYVKCICPNGHECNIKPNGSTQQGGGMCKTCSGHDSKIAEENFRKRIEELGGRVIGEYVRNSAPIECICPEGHECKTLPNGIQQGGGMCIICSGKDSKTVEDTFRKRIEELGGRVIGEYTGAKFFIDCVCPEGHNCRTTPYHIKSGGYMCKICSGHDPKTAEDNFRKRVTELGGRVIGEYITSSTPIECICVSGHICYSLPSGLQQGRGMCSTCSGYDSKIAEENFRKRIQELGGRVIGEYNGANNRVKCICSNGHNSYVRPCYIQQGGGMCKICSENDPKISEETFRKRVEELGGRVIGEYINSVTPIKCICSNGHYCSPRASGVKQGQGICIICAGKDSKTAQDSFRKRIEELGGRVIGEYICSKNRVNCICSKGHDCQPTWSYIRSGGSMCPTCSQNGYSQAQISWLNYIQDEEKINIRHAENGGEFRIGKYKVDGYCESTNTVYEFHGDFWHGNPKFYEHTDTNPVNKKTFGELLKATLHKEMSIRRSGYKYTCIWECEWNLMK
jgi:hypothetical protein